MLAFIFAGLVFVATLIVCWFMAFANGMSPTGIGDLPVGTVFVVGTIIAALIAASHWLPHVSW